MRRFIRISVEILLVVGALLLLGGSIAGFIPSPNYYLDNIAQLRIAFFLLLIPLSVIALAVRSRAAVVITVTALVIQRCHLRLSLCSEL